jgi:hypothetical protein
MIDRDEAARIAAADILSRGTRTGIRHITWHTKFRSPSRTSTGAPTWINVGSSTLSGPFGAWNPARSFSSTERVARFCITARRTTKVRDHVGVLIGDELVHTARIAGGHGIELHFALDHGQLFRDIARLRVRGSGTTTFL